MTRLLGRLATAAALGVAILALLAPLGVMLWRSLAVEVVELNTGEQLMAIGGVERRGDTWRFATQSSPGAERISEIVPDADVTSVRKTLSLHHHRFVWTDPRLVGLLTNSIGIAFGGAVLALLFGLPLAWLYGRTNLRGRGLWAALSILPALLPPFFVALGGARRWQDAVAWLLGWSGQDLQRGTSALVFGLVLAPFVLHLVGPQWARLPEGPYQAARVFGGRRAAFRLVVLPRLAPVVLGSFVLVFVLALADFAVPDLLGFMLPGGGMPTHVFATEVLFQWKQNQNVGRAVAAATPFVALTGILVVVAAWLLARRRASADAAEPTLERRRLGPAGTAAAHIAWLAWIFVAIAVPILGVVAWAGAGGESSSAGAGGSPAGVESAASPAARSERLLDFRGTIERTVGVREDIERWLAQAAVAALVALAVAVVLARRAAMCPRLRPLLLLLGILGLGVPPIVLSAGVQALTLQFPFLAQSSPLVAPVLALVARLLPVGLLIAWAALGTRRREEEEAAALAGAGPFTRFASLVAGPALVPLLVGAFVLFVLGLRELEALMLVDSRILPSRLYDKIHFSRLVDEANLLLLAVGVALLPLVPAALLWLLRAGTRAGRGGRPPAALG